MFNQPLRFCQWFALFLLLTCPMIGFAGDALPNGSSVSGSITNDGTSTTVDSWTFSANAGDYTYLAFVVTSSPKGASLCFNVLRPNGDRVGCNYGSNQIYTPQTGVYTVQVVWGSGAPSTVSYEMTLAEAGSSFAGSLVGNGSPTLGSLANAGTLAEYTAYIPAGVSFFATVGTTTQSGGYMGMQITDPNGVQLSSGFYTDYNNVNSLTSIGGNYRFVLYGASGLTEIGYRFTVAVGGVSPAGLAGGKVISDGTYAGSMGRGVLDEWPFDTAAGQQVMVSIAAASGNPQGAGVAFDIFDPTGAKLFSGLTPNWKFTPATGGVYRVVIYRSDVGNGAYFQNALYNLTLIGSVVPIPEVTLLDPVVTNSGSNLLDGSSITTDPSRLSSGGRPVSGIAADGTAEILLRITGVTVGQQITLSVAPPSLESDLTGALRNLNSPVESFQVTVLGQNTSPPMAFAIYRAPKDFSDGTIPLTTGQRILNVHVQTTGGTAADTPVVIMRPPVVLVHGYASNADETWSTFTPLETDTGTFAVFLADYGQPLFTPDLAVADPTLAIQSTTPSTDIGYLWIYGRRSHLGFSYNVTDVAAQIQRFIRDFDTGANPSGFQVAGIQADIVAHSMGGLLTRYWSTLPTFLVGQNFNKGFVHRLITLGTPHFGSPPAILSLLPAAQCTRNFGDANGRFAFSSVTLVSSAQLPGASAELSGDGIGVNVNPKIQTILSGRSYFPIAALAGDAYLANDIGVSIAAGIRLRCSTSSDPYSSRFTSDKFDTLFDPQITASNPSGNGIGRPNDGAVPLTSALNDINDTNGSNCNPENCYLDYAHGKGTAQLFGPVGDLAFGLIPYLTDNSQIISFMVENLLNMPTATFSSTK